MNYCNIYCPGCGKRRTKFNFVKNHGRCIECKRKDSREKIKARRSEPNSKRLEYDRQWKTLHPENVKAWNKRWVDNNKDRFKLTNSKRQKRYRQKHIEQVRLWKIKYQNKRYREMGTIPLNEPFKGSQGHHINKNYVIHIPKDLHRSIWHNHNKPETMTLINIRAFEYLMYC